MAWRLLKGKARKRIYSSYANCNSTVGFFLKQEWLAEGIVMAVIRKSSTRLRVVVVAFVAMVLSFPSLCGASVRKVLIFPFHVTSRSAGNDLQNFSDHVNKSLRSTVGNLSDNFTLVSDGITQDLLKGKDAPKTEEEAVSMGREAHPDIVICGVLSSEDRFQFKGVMWDVQAGRALVSTDVKVSNIHGLPAVLQMFINSVNKRLQGSPRLPLYRSESPVSTDVKQLTRMPTLVALPRNTGPWRSPEIRSTLLGLDVGDLDGDKKNEIVFIEAGGVTIYRFEDGTLRPLTQFSESPAEYISVEIEDLDGDGVPELILCYQRPSGIESAIIRYAGRDFRIAVKIPNVILKAIKEPSIDPKKRVLVGQRTDVDNILSGEVTRYSLDGDKLTPGENITLPPGTLILSYECAQLGKAGEFFRMILNQDQRLLLFDRENRLIASVTDHIYGHDRKLRLQGPNGMKEIVCPGRIIIADIKGDGENELLIAKNGERGSYIQALGWNGSQLAEKWKTVEGQGNITDFGIRDFKNQGTQSLVLILAKRVPFLALSGAHSVIYAYDLIP